MSTSAQPHQPTVFVNVFRFDGLDMPLEHPVLRTRAKAVEDAEEHADRYVYTLTDTGKINLEPEFSERWHERKDLDTAVDADIDRRKEERVSA